MKLKIVKIVGIEKKKKWNLIKLKKNLALIKTNLINKKKSQKHRWKFLSKEKYKSQKNFITTEKSLIIKYFYQKVITIING